MCGIFALLNNQTDTSVVNNEFIKGRARGPEFSKLDISYNKLVIGFHRLAINGLNDVSNQPLIINDVVLICNGEIYNYKNLYKYMDIEPITGSDCEVIIHLYIKYGIEQTLTMLDGEFSFILYDKRNVKDVNNIYIARDPYGVRPLYYLKSSYLNVYGFASELKCIEHFYNTDNSVYTVEQFPPGTYSVFKITNDFVSYWFPIKEFVPYFIPNFSYSYLTKENFDVHNISQSISKYLNFAVHKRCLTTERPIACLLSGGLDSSLVSALASNYYKINGSNTKLETYSIGLFGSEDLKYARIVAEYIDSNHTEIIVTEEEMFDAIPQVIYAIESYDTTTVRASIGNYLLGKYIAANSKAKVILNGDGSDELFGGYLYMNNCPNDIEFDKETRRLLHDIHNFDVLRSDKSISSNGLEPRTPFLDRSFVNYVLSIPPHIRNHNNFNAPEKNLLRTAFTSKYFKNNQGLQLLPDEILWRKKEAFSDGVSSHGRSLYQILQEKIANSFNFNSEIGNFKLEPNINTEKKYYKNIFDSKFPNCQNILPYYWMPKYTNASDPSARTLSFYSNK